MPEVFKLIKPSDSLYFHTIMVAPKLSISEEENDCNMTEIVLICFFKIQSIAGKKKQM